MKEKEPNYSRHQIAVALFFLGFAVVANAQGEIGPHFPQDGFVYIGEVYGNSAYIAADDGGEFAWEGQDGTVHADVWIAREDFYIIVKHPKKDLFAILDTSDPGFGKKKLSELEFTKFLGDSLPRKAWIRAGSPKDYDKDRKVGKEFTWIYVDVNGDEKHSDRFYVSPEIKSDQNSGCLFVTVMIVNEERCSVSIDPSKKRFSAVLTDLFRVPVEKETFREMKPGDLSEAVLKFVNRKQARKEANKALQSIAFGQEAKSMSLAQINTGAGPTEAINLSTLDRFALGIIYWILGVAASFCVGVAIGSAVGAFRSTLALFRSKTAWFALLTFCLVAYIALGFAVATLPIAGNLGDATGYRMQGAMIVGAIFPGLFTWMMPIGLLAIGSAELARSASFRSYAFVYGGLIYYVCGFLGLYIVFSFLTQTLSPKAVVLSLLVYPITFFVAPIIMVIKHGIWLPLALHYGGLLLGGFVMYLGEEKKA